MDQYPGPDACRQFAHHVSVAIPSTAAASSTSRGQSVTIAAPSTAATTTSASGVSRRMRRHQNERSPTRPVRSADRTIPAVTR